MIVLCGSLLAWPLRVLTQVSRMWITPSWPPPRRPPSPATASSSAATTRTRRPGASSTTSVSRWPLTDPDSNQGGIRYHYITVMILKICPFDRLTFQCIEEKFSQHWSRAKECSPSFRYLTIEFPRHTDQSFLCLFSFCKILWNVYIFSVLSIQNSICPGVQRSFEAGSLARVRN